jgi:hypothetical protein
MWREYFTATENLTNECAARKHLLFIGLLQQELKHI